MKSFADALFANFSQHKKMSAFVFQDELVKIEINFFWFEQRTIPNKIDNLLKFIMVDTLQKQYLLIMTVKLSK